MRITFENNVAVVTGGSKGMGGSTTTRLLEEGASTAALDVDEKRGAARIAEYPDRGLFIKCDVSDSTQVTAAFDQVLERFGGVDILVNNAGFITGQPVRIDGGLVALIHNPIRI
jgi:NAD(P)-dependent dehydrogenase (short-subunit alcohol dehydrogenase family)